MIKKAFDIVGDIILIVCCMVFIARLIIEIKTMAELEYLGNCVIINNEYYCKQIEKKENNGVKM